MKRIYINNKLEENLIYILDQDQSIHLSKVIRLKLKDNLLIFNNSDGEWLAEIKNIDKKAISVRCLNKISNTKTIPNIDLFFSPIKYQNSETIIRQSTEIGIRDLFPTLFQRTIISRVNKKKFDSYALSAVQQSGRTQRPNIHELKEIYNQKQNLFKKNIIMFDENLRGQQISNIKIDKSKDICVVVGPEGGFTDKERILIASLSANFYNIKLGPRILKADTAVVSALSLVFHYFSPDND